MSDDPRTLEEAREALFRLERRAGVLQKRVDRLETVAAVLRRLLSADAAAPGADLFLDAVASAGGMLRFDEALAVVEVEPGRLRCQAATAPALVGARIAPGALAAKALGGRTISADAGRLLDFAAPGAPFLFGADAPALAAPFVQGGRPGFALFLRGVDAAGFDREDMETAAQIAVLAAQALAMKAAARAASARERLLCAMSHELRTPLNGVLGMGDLLEREPLTHRARESARVIRESALGLLGSIERILDYVQIESGDAALDRAPFGLLAVARAAAARHAVAARAKGVAFAFWYDPFLPYRVMGDGARVAELMDALLENAIRATLAGEVRVRVDGANTDGRLWAQVSVCDDGPGVPPEDREAIFQPFDQGGHALGARRPGLALGLALGRVIARGLGGSLTVEEGSTGGARFVFAAPFDIDRAAEAPETGGALDGLGVLLVDPQPGPRAALAQRLRLWGARVCEASEPPSFAEARDAIGARGLALVAADATPRLRARWLAEAPDRAALARLPLLRLDPTCADRDAPGPGIVSPFTGRRAFLARLRETAASGTAQGPSRAAG